MTLDWRRTDVDSPAVSSPVVSCIVAVVNGEPYLREATDSIVQQTYRPRQRP
jgi:hypothetical protein